jgi:hypothetical protein
MKPAIYFLSLIFTTTLAGCVATGSLAIRGNGLPDNYADIANEMATLARQQCVKRQGYTDQSKDDWRTVRRMDTPDWLIRRFFTSSGPWVKAEAVSQGVLDDLYYEPNLKVLICGAHSWGKFDGSAQVRFIAFGENVRTTSLPSVPFAGAYPTSQPGGSSSASERRSISVRWDGVSTVMSGEIALLQDKSMASLQFQLPNGGGTCTGLAQSTSAAGGIWMVSCPNNMSASGSFLSNGGGFGASGVGKDTQGKGVMYTVGLR